MNNFTFGNENLGFYETICGGSGAGPSWHGASAVHTHMTNSRLTDPEVLEWRFPVLVESFEIRRGSGGVVRVVLLWDSFLLVVETATSKEIKDCKC